MPIIFTSKSLHVRTFFKKIVNRIVYCLNLLVYVLLPLTPLLEKAISALRTGIQKFFKYRKQIFSKKSTVQLSEQIRGCLDKTQFMKNKTKVDVSDAVNDLEVGS